MRSRPTRARSAGVFATPKEEYIWDVHQKSWCPGRPERHVDNSKRIAGLLGPTIVAMVASEFPLVQPHLYDAQIPPVVYLSGTLMFIGGLAVVRAHNSWTRDWTLLVTLSGWFFLTLGLFRMFAASHYLRSAATTDATVFMALEGILFVLGLFITFKAYSRGAA